MESNRIFGSGLADHLAAGEGPRFSTVRDATSLDRSGRFLPQHIPACRAGRMRLCFDLRARLLAVLLLLAAGVLTGCAVRQTPTVTSPSHTPVSTTNSVQIPTPLPSTTISPVVPPTTSLTAALPSNTPTPEPGGRTLVLTPQASDVGWWASNDTQAKHLGDSFLYAGHFDNEVFASAIRFDLQGMPRGAPIREAVLQLTGLRDDRLAAEAGDVPWTVQFVNPQALPELARTDFQALYNAPAEVVLFPTLNAADLKTLKVNSLALDASAREWLAQQLANGTTSVIARIAGPTGGTPTLFRDLLSWQPSHPHRLMF
jgi:hypothetical protein